MDRHIRSVAVVLEEVIFPDRGSEVFGAVESSSRPSQ
jgi:hypothetical protein